MKSAKEQVLWSAAFEYTLTTSLVASDSLNINFSDAITIYPYYKAGAAESGNTVDLLFEANPLSAAEDSAGAFWSPFGGQYTNSTGTWSEEDATYNVAQGTAEVYQAGQPIHLSNTAFQRFRVKAKENGVASAAGKLKLIIVKHNKNN